MQYSEGRIVRWSSVTAQAQSACTLITGCKCVYSALCTVQHFVHKLLVLRSTCTRQITPPPSEKQKKN